MRRRWLWIVLIGLVLTAEKVKRIQNLPRNHNLQAVAPQTSAAPVIAGPPSSRAYEISELAPDPAAEADAWLQELNRWREAAGVAPSVANSALSFGSERHARYLVNEGPLTTAAFRIYDRTIGPGAHIERRSAQWYTAEGAEAAQGGRLSADIIQCADVAWEGRDQRADMDQLLLAPFHRFSLLAPWALVAGYGSYGEYPRRVAALALRGPIDDLRQERTVEFPPDDSEIPWNAMVGSEWPNPLAVCSPYKVPVGIPITVQNGGRLDLVSYSLRDESNGKPLDACAFDARRYASADPVQERRGRELLAAYGAIILLPRHPLRRGDRYRVDIDARQGHFAWSFGVSRFPPSGAHPLAVRSASATPRRKRGVRSLSR